MDKNKPQPDYSGSPAEWLGSDRGQFEHMRDRIKFNQVATVIENLKGFTWKANTVNDLEIIINYMHMKAPKNSIAKCRQICNLQGFFLRTGGFFLVAA